MKRLSTFALLLFYAGCGAFAVPGRACRKHEECDGLERGYCARVEICTRECSDTLPCPENSACSVQGPRSVCLPKCEDDSGCFSTFVCRAGVCQVKAPFEPPAK